MSGEDRCVLCKTVIKLGLEIKFKFTVLLIVIMMFNGALETLYWVSQKDLIVQDVDHIVPITTRVLYWLYAIEFVIMVSMLYARII